MVGMKGVLVGIPELDAITEDARVVDADSKKSAMCEATIEVWSCFKI